ncbi:hypothetical protein ACIQ1J_22275 [Streptomyces sp. NPDC097107]|uniref:hypothetical protein n=1 Tax=Streptomyces sp. NPDC097107 TaxID=3366089 RepID=UPI00380F61FC
MLDDVSRPHAEFADHFAVVRRMRAEAGHLPRGRWPAPVRTALITAGVRAFLHGYQPRTAWEKATRDTGSPSVGSLVRAAQRADACPARTVVGNLFWVTIVFLPAHLDEESSLVRQIDGPFGARSPTSPPGVS